jgi:hypothetical protein
MNAGEILQQAADTFKARNAEYGNNYKDTGAALLALFPGHKLPAITTPEQANRLCLVIACLSKLTRYTHSFDKGHKDSARDLAVYAAMLEEETGE